MQFSFVIGSIYFLKILQDFSCWVGYIEAEMMTITKFIKAQDSDSDIRKPTTYGSNLTARNKVTYKTKPRSEIFFEKFNYWLYLKSDMFMTRRQIFRRKNKQIA